MKRVLFLSFIFVLLLSSCSSGDYNPITGTYDDYDYGYDEDTESKEIELLKGEISHLEEELWRLQLSHEECLDDWYTYCENAYDTLYDVAQYYDIDEDELIEVYDSYCENDNYEEIIKSYKDDIFE